MILGEADRLGGKGRQTSEGRSSIARISVYCPQCRLHPAPSESVARIAISVFNCTSVFNVFISHTLLELSGMNVFYQETRPSALAGVVKAQLVKACSDMPRLPV